MKLKPFILLAWLLLNIQLNSMDALNILPIKEIFKQIQSPLSLQEMSRFSRTCSIIRKGIDVENFCECSDAYCLSPACVFLRHHYDVGTKVLAHYDKTKNNKMFDHIFMQNAKTRLEEVQILNRGRAYNYSKYDTRKKIEKKRLIQCVRTLDYDYYSKQAIPLLKKILKGSSFNIFDSAKSYRKRRVWYGSEKYLFNNIFFNVRYEKDADLLLAILGGVIEPRAFKYILPYVSYKLINELWQKGVVVENVPDKKGRDFAFYMKARFGQDICSQP